MGNVHFPVITKWTLPRTFCVSDKLPLVSFTKQGHPMDLLLKLSVLQANFCLLGDLQQTICPRKESVAGI